MKKIGILLFALLTVGFLATGSYAQHGRDTTHHNGGLDSTKLGDRDSTSLGDNDSTEFHGRDTIKIFHDPDSTAAGDNDSTEIHVRDTTNHKDTTDHHGRDTTDHHGRDTTIHHNGGKDGHTGDHGRVNLFLLLRSDSCRLDLESKMTAADVITLEADLAALKLNADTIKTLLGQLRTARKAHDTATFRALAIQLKTLITTERTIAKSLADLLAKYASVINTVWHDCHMKGDHGTNNGGGTDLRLEAKSLFPNPVNPKSSTGGTVTLMYMISADADVKITLSDAQGTLVQTVVADHEVAGQHTATINVSALAAGVYYVRLQAGTEVRTQKLVVVQ